MEVERPLAVHLVWYEDGTVTGGLGPPAGVHRVPRVASHQRHRRHREGVRLDDRQIVRLRTEELKQLVSPLDVLRLTVALTDAADPDVPASGLHVLAHPLQ